MKCRGFIYSVPACTPVKLSGSVEGRQNIFTRSFTSFPIIGMSLNSNDRNAHLIVKTLERMIFEVISCDQSCSWLPALVEILQSVRAVVYAYIK